MKCIIKYKKVYKLINCYELYKAYIYKVYIYIRYISYNTDIIYINICILLMVIYYSWFTY